MEADETVTVTDIFFSNGQINWDAISTISNIILVAALVAITYWYAKKVSEQTEVMMKDRERKRILEEVQDFLTPTVHRLKDETNAIRENKVYWNAYNDKSYIIGLSKLLPDETDYGSTIFDIITKYPNLKDQLFSHDRLYDRLNELYSKIRDEIIMGSDFKDRLRVMIEKFNEERGPSNQLTGEREEKAEVFYTMCIINERIPGRTSDQSAPYLDFWDQYKDKLLRFKDTTPIQNLEKEVENTLDQVKKLNEKLLSEIKSIIGKYREEYHLTKKEIDPERERLKRTLGSEVI